MSGIGHALERWATRFLIWRWARREPVELPARSMSPAAGDNLQQTMNLMMPLKHPGPRTTAELLRLLQLRVDDIQGGLDTVGTVHFARFAVIGDQLAMFSVFDGDFETYIRDFIALFGHVFDALMGYVIDPPPLPTGHYPSALVDWVRARDLVQLPHNTIELSDDMDLLTRRMLLTFHQHPEVQLGVYRGYAGFSAAQIRQGLGIEWGSVQSGAKQ